jgi:PhoD-like phosphatase
MLRYVGEEAATLWVETDASCRVTVKAGPVQGEAATFHVADHHYALVVVTGLPGEGGPVPYVVELDGRRAWPPPAYDFPAPVIRPLHSRERATLLFGSCRVALPHEPPFTWSQDEDRWGFGRDAIFAYAERMARRQPRDWPDLVFWCGDQVYADELSPWMDSQVTAARRRGVRAPPGEAATFEEYALLYRDSWSEPVTRWFLSVVPSAMIFDDHDVHDDWNTSLSWMEDRRRQEWWEPKMAAALASYWIYQHAGNLAPESLAEDEMWHRVRAAASEEDLWPAFERFGVAADRDHHGVRWSFCRAVGSSKLVVMDSRAGRSLEPHDRRMMDREEWAWIESEARGDRRHLLLGTSLPWLMAPALHDLEAWNEAVAEGAWSPVAERLVGERARRALDLEHWAAFGESFAALAELVRAVGAGERGEPPSTIVALSGDVHHAYLAEGIYPAQAGVRSRVWQAVCSPMRNPLSSRERRMFRALRRRPAVLAARALRRAAGVADPPLRWREVAGPSFDNQIATIELDGARATLRIERATGDPSDPPRLEAWLERRLDGAAQGPAVRPPARARAVSR